MEISVELLMKMNKTLMMALLVHLATYLPAQTETSTPIEHGVLFSTRIDSDDDFNFQVKGFGIEGGYYFLKKVGKNGMISLDCRLAYAQSERDYVNVLDQTGLRPSLDSLQTRRTGTVNYSNFSLSLPIKYRHQLNQKIPVFFLIGFNPYFNLVNLTEWEFDELEFNLATGMDISLEFDQEEELEQRFYSRDLILLGLGYKKDNLMVDLYFSGGTTEFDNDFISGMDKLSIVLSAYYRLH